MDFEERMQKLSQHQAALSESPARQRLTRLVDAGSLVETDAFATGANAVTGYGLVNDRPVYLVAQDASSQGGAMSGEQARKMLKTLDLALKTGAPVVLLPDSKGAKVGEGAQVLASYAQVFAKLGELQGICPVISLLAGEATGVASHFAALSDIAVAVKGAAVVSPFAPSVISAVAGKALDAQAMGGAEALAQKGAVALTAANEDEGIALVRQLIDLLPSSCDEYAPLVEGDDLNRLLQIPPADAASLALNIADQGSAIELYGAWRQTSRVWLARVGGYSVGLVSCSPEIDGGRLDAYACDKIARFVSFCDAYNLPVITLVDSEGLAVPTVEGQSWLMTASSRMLSCYAAATTAKLAVITGNAVGAAYVAFAGQAIADLTFAWPGAYIAPLTRQASVQTFDAAQLQSEDRASLEAKAAQQADAFGAAEAGLVDNVIDPAQTRKHLIAALELLATKQA